MRRTRTLPALAGLLGTLGLAAPAAAPAARLAPCNGMSGFGCGFIRVPLDRSGAMPGTLRLRFAAQTARHAARRPGVLIALTGGPGQDGVSIAPTFSFTLAPLLKRYRLAVLDQRGTGRSGALVCPELQDQGDVSTPTADAVAQCAERIGPRAAFYSTLDSVEDIDALRRALHVERIALMGVSYGTFVAQQYARVHPDRVERLILDSVVGPGGIDAFARESFAAVPRVLREQCARQGCEGVTRDPVADVAALVSRLNAGERLAGRVFDLSGRPRDAAYTSPDDLFDLLVAGDLNDYLRAALPAAVRATVRGDATPLLRLRRIAEGGPLKPTQLSFAVFGLTTCEDTRLPYSLTDPVERRLDLTEQAAAGLAGSLLAPFDAGSARRLSYAQGCLFFPPGAIAPPSSAPLPDVPTLILSGRLDLRTPLESARALATELPRSRVVAVPGTGHDELDRDLSGCTQAALRRFIAKRPVHDPCAGVSNAVPVVPLPPRSLGDYRAAAQVPGKRGRVVSAVVDTVLDAQLVALQTVFAGFTDVRAGGLRGGWLRFDDHGAMALHRYALLGGLRVRGRLADGADAPHGLLRVDGPGRLDGTVRLLADGGVRGRIGGRRVLSPPVFAITAAGRGRVARGAGTWLRGGSRLARLRALRKSAIPR